MLGSVKSLDNLVRPHRQRWRNRQAKRLRCLRIDGQLVLGWLHEPGDCRSQSAPLVSRLADLTCVLVEGGHSFGQKDPARNVDPRLRATLGSEHHGLGLTRHDTH
jgi:hypothetical protein